MRAYGTVFGRFWTGATGKALRGHPEAQLVALYLMTCPGSHMIGLYSLALPTLCHETGLPLEGALEGLRRLSEGGFAQYDEASEVVWLPEMANFQIGEELKIGPRGPDNRIAMVETELKTFQKSRFYNEFLDRYAAAFKLNLKRSGPGPDKPPGSPSEGPSDPLGSQSRAEQIADQKKEIAEIVAAPPVIAAPRPAQTDAAGQIDLPGQQGAGEPAKPRRTRKKPEAPPSAFTEVRAHFEECRRELTGVAEYEWAKAKDSEGINAILALVKGDVEKAKSYITTAARMAPGDKLLRIKFTPAMLGMEDVFNTAKAWFVAQGGGGTRQTRQGNPDECSAPGVDATDAYLAQREERRRQLEAERAEGKAQREKAGAA